ncbi:MAG: ParA family protein [Nitrospirae bacterium]|nr:ParA family protein [Nitrospirota bacterium]
MGRIISIANQKGGVGKTTTAINLAASIALAGKNILIVDTDPQCNSTSGVGINRNHITKSIYDVYTSKYSIEETIIGTSFEHLHIVPASVDLLAVEIELVSRERREWVLSDALNLIREAYQYIFIDCPPSLGLLTLNALAASDSVIIPVQCEYYALEGLSMLTRTINLVQRSFNPALAIEGILLTMYDARNTLSAQVAAEVQTYFDKRVYTTIIPRNVTLGEAPGHGKPALYYDVRSKGAQTYLSLAREVLNEKGIGPRP